MIMDKENKSDSTAQSLADACVRCGTCMTVCPLYQIGRQEVLCARGKLALITWMDSTQKASLSEFSGALDLCLSCGRCTANCPNHVPATQAILSARSQISEMRGTSGSKALKWVLGNQSHMAEAMNLAKRSLWLGMKLGPLRQMQDMLTLGRPTFLATVPKHYIPSLKGNRVGVFVGCMGNYLRPHLMHKLLRLLGQRHELIIPKEQGCCGLPAMSLGLQQVAVQNALINLRAFHSAGVERIVTICGSCAYMFRKALPPLLDDPVLKILATNVVEVTELMAASPEEFASLKAISPDQPVEVHHPCHMKTGLGVYQEPIEVLLKAGAHIISKSGLDACCGGGGAFSVKHPKFSHQVFAAVDQKLIESEASVLATSCNGCFLQWVFRTSSAVSIVHPIELLE